MFKKWAYEWVYKIILNSTVVGSFPALVVSSQEGNSGKSPYKQLLISLTLASISSFKEKDYRGYGLFQSSKRLRYKCRIP